MEHQQHLGRRRVLEIIGLVVGLAFIALGVTAYFAGGGPIIPIIAVAGGLLIVIAAVVNLVRS